MILNSNYKKYEDNTEKETSPEIFYSPCFKSSQIRKEKEKDSNNSPLNMENKENKENIYLNLNNITNIQNFTQGIDSDSRIYRANNKNNNTISTNLYDLDIYTTSKISNSTNISTLNTYNNNKSLKSIKTGNTTTNTFKSNTIAKPSLLTLSCNVNKYKDNFSKINKKLSSEEIELLKIEAERQRNREIRKANNQVYCKVQKMKVKENRLYSPLPENPPKKLTLQKPFNLTTNSTSTSSNNEMLNKKRLILNC